MSTLSPQRLDGSTGNNITVTSGTTLKGEVPGAFMMEGMCIQVAYAETPVGNTYTLNYTLDLCIIPDMYIDFKPVYATSKIYLMAMVNGNFPHVSSVGFFRDGVNMQKNWINQIQSPAATTISDVNGTTTYTPGGWGWQGNNNNVFASLHTTYPGYDATDRIWNYWIQYSDVDNRSNARRRYQVGVNASWGDTIRAFKVNDRDSNDMRSITNLCVMEIV
jgi:hypothetical protein